MSAPTIIIGVDPGPLAGICVLHAASPPIILQVPHEYALQEIRNRLVSVPVGWALLAVERYVVGYRSTRSAHQRAGRLTRDMVGALCAFDSIATVVIRTASEVKPWATDKRLNAVGLLNATRGMPHARDAARHALFAAVHAGAMPDPLSPVQPATGED